MRRQPTEDPALRKEHRPGMEDVDATSSWPTLTDGDLTALMRLRNQVRERGYRHGRPWTRSGIGHLLQIGSASLLLEPITVDKWSGRVSCNGRDFPPCIGSTRGDAARAAVSEIFAHPLMVSMTHESMEPETDVDTGFIPRPF